MEASYGYCDKYQPHAVKRMFDNKNNMLYDMRWDEAGNTEDCCGPRPCGANRMHAAVDADNYSYYTYDYTGERTLKLTGRMGQGTGTCPNNNK